MHLFSGNKPKFPKDYTNPTPISFATRSDFLTWAYNEFSHNTLPQKTYQQIQTEGYEFGGWMYGPPGAKPKYALLLQQPGKGMYREESLWQEDEESKKRNPAALARVMSGVNGGGGLGRMGNGVGGYVPRYTGMRGRVVPPGVTGGVGGAAEAPGMMGGMNGGFGGPRQFGQGNPSGGSRGQSQRGFNQRDPSQQSAFEASSQLKSSSRNTAPSSSSRKHYRYGPDPDKP